MVTRVLVYGIERFKIWGGGCGGASVVTYVFRLQKLRRRKLRNSFPSHNGVKHNWGLIVELC